MQSTTDLLKSNPNTMKKVVLIMLVLIAVCAIITHVIVTEPWRPAPKFENWLTDENYKELITRPVEFKYDWTEPTPETTGGKGKEN